MDRRGLAYAARPIAATIYTKPPTWPVGWVWPPPPWPPGTEPGALIAAGSGSSWEHPSCDSADYGFPQWDPTGTLNPINIPNITGAGDLWYVIGIVCYGIGLATVNQWVFATPQAGVALAGAAISPVWSYDFAEVLAAINDPLIIGNTYTVKATVVTSGGTFVHSFECEIQG